MSGAPQDGRATSPYIPTAAEAHSKASAMHTPPSNPANGQRDATPRGRAHSSADQRNASPRGITPSSQPRPKQSVDLERKPSTSYGHHRQTSIVHGIQHARNPSLLSTANASPLSPAKIMESGREDSSDGADTHTLRKSPSASALLPAAHGLEPGTVRKPSRKQSIRTKRSADESAMARGHKPMPTQTVGEYALHHLFTSFIAEAEQRISRLLSTNIYEKPQERIEAVCGPGADAGFDQLIRSLGHINRHKPKPVIDAVMLWRKQKKDEVMSLLQKACADPRQLDRLEQVYAAGYMPASSLSPQEVHLSQRIFHQQDFVDADIRCQISTYILCRALVDIISQTTVEAMNAHDPDFTTKLEDTVFRQLEDHDVGLARRNDIQQATLAMRGRLLGVMSGLRFVEVARRFTTPLDEDFKFLCDKSAPAQYNDKDRADWKEKWDQANSRTPLLLRSMRWLKFSTQPERAWEISCLVIQMLAKFFSEVHGRQIKHAYSELLEHLLLPIAATGSAEFNNAKWKNTIDRMRPRVAQMLTKADHWAYAYPLQTVLLSVSPGETFAAQWLPTITAFQPKNRDRNAKSHALKAICRLVWRYLYRFNDSQIAVSRKLEEVVKHVFQTSRRLLISTDPIIADPLIQLIRIIGYKYQDLCFRTIIFPLMNYELLSAQGDGLSIENLDPEKTVIGIRAFLAIMTDLEKGEPPPFPTSFECDSFLDPVSRNTNSSHRRTRSLGFAVSAGRTERLSQPIISANLSENERGYYAKFCAMLGTLTKICDRDFGGEAALNEKINAANNTKTPKASDFATFGRKDDPVSAAELRQNYYDLLHVAVEALPRCLSPALPISELVSLLCTGTAHVQSHIAESSAQSLKSIARHSYAQVITLGFARFIFNFDDKYATVSDGGLLGPGHIESTLKLYVELLSIWIDSLEQKARPTVLKVNGTSSEDQAPAPAVNLGMSGIHAMVDEVEAHGLFFLCWPSEVVRAVAIDVLRLVTKFDVVLGKPVDRIIGILEGSTEAVIDVNDERLTLAERSRLQKGLRATDHSSTLVELCSSEVPQDANLWLKLFPNLIARSLETCFSTVVLTREIVCKRLSHAQASIEWHAHQSRPNYPMLDTSFGRRATGRAAAGEVVIEQWKLHLIFVCTTMTKVGKSMHLATPGQAVQHTRKSSKSSTSTEEARIASATELFPAVVNFIYAPNPAVREAAIVGLGATNATLFQALLESLHPAVQECLQESKTRADMHQRAIGSPRRNPRTDTCRLGVTHLLSLTVHLLKETVINGDEYVMEYMADFAKHLRTWLNDVDIQGHVEYHKLRTYFCSFMEGLYDATRKLQHASRWLSFQGRQATFQLMENWCGFSPNEKKLREHETHYRRSILDREQDFHHRGIIDAAIEKEKSELATAALSAMATLCAGPLCFVANGNVLMEFNIRRMLTWINTIFENKSDRSHATGRKALQNLIVNNPGDQQLMAQSLRMCYTARLPKALTSYFEVVTYVLVNNINVQVPFWKVLCVGLYTLGNEDSNIRMKSARLLRRLEERQDKVSRLQDLDISVSDKTTAVYKLAQFEISCRLAKHHPELAFHVFSEFSAYFNELQPDHQRNMVTGMLPWIQTTELMLDRPEAGPTTTSYMLLVNLFEITVKSQNTMHNEIQALWQALASGPYGGNVQLVLDFIINLCLSQREQNFVIYAKQIVVFLASTAAGAKVIEYLVMQINPKNMIAERRDLPIPATDAGLPYVADVDHILPSGTRQGGMSLGQLSMILLVDLIVTPDKVAVAQLPVLLQAILVSWDHYTSIIQEQARELLVHLIHELVISKTEPDKDDIEDFIELLRNNDAKIMWSYEDNEVHTGADDGRSVCSSTGFVVDECVRVFSVVYPDIREEWGKVAIFWATQCAVRHVACRSFQVFRCTSTTLDEQMLSDMLARLSNTIADDEHADFLIFSLEILITLRCIVQAIDRADLVHYPQLFWTTCACLDTIFEPEFREGLSMLSYLLEKLDLSDPGAVRLLESSKPPKWKGEFSGLLRLVWKGIRSAKSMDKALVIMDQLMKLPSNSIIGENDRLMMTVLANLPRFIRVYQTPATFAQVKGSAEALAACASAQKFELLSQVLEAFAQQQIRARQEFIVKIIDAIRLSFFPKLEFKCLVSLLGMVNNQEDWFKVNTMDAINIILRDLDMRKPEIVSQGPDLITPLLRLLQTKHCQQALEVLDNVVDMTGTPLDNKHLRMSMIGSHSSRASKKEYSGTKSLHGIPDESGWSVPMPAMHSERTRSNVHAVFSTLTYTDQNGGKQIATTPEINFQKDEDHLDSYFTDRTAYPHLEERIADGNMGELAMKLDDLDDFFEDDDDMTASAGSPRYPSVTVEPRENLYEKQALPILHRSLHRNPSMTSLNDMHYRIPMDPTPAMSPAAFVPPVATTRPSLHNRSVTTPVALTRSPPRLDKDMLSGDEAGDEPEPFSDDDLAIGRAHTSDEPFHMANTVRPAGFRANFRQGLRRLTSTSAGRESVKGIISAPLKSPKMPKVPPVFLSKDPMSGEP